MHWWPEDHLDLILLMTGDWKVGTGEELEAALKEPMQVAPTRTSGFTRAQRMRRGGCGRLWEMDRD